MPDKCQHIRNEIEALEADIDHTQEELKTAAGAEKQALIFLIKFFQAQLALKVEELKICEASTEPPLTDPRVFGSEISQGILEYELVAGKDTLARVFVGARQQVVVAVSAAAVQAESRSSMHFDVPLFGASRLDFAILHVTGPRGIDFDIPGQMSTGEFTNTSQSFSEDDNVNFYFPGSQLPHIGTYTFDASFYRNGILVGTLSLGQRMFHATKDLRLLIGVNTWPMPVEAWNTLFNMLLRMHRNFPLRAGIGPIDGDQSLGLRYFIDPVPYDTDWPGWGPVRAKLAEFNAQQAAHGKPDRADKIMSVRTQQSGEVPLGGVGEMLGTVSGVILNVNPPGDSYFATIISQELGHNFGLGHSVNPEIDAPSAFDLLNRKTISNPQSIMYNPVGGNDRCLFLPEDWKTIREGLLTLESTGPS